MLTLGFIGILFGSCRAYTLLNRHHWQTSSPDGSTEWESVAADRIVWLTPERIETAGTLLDQDSFHLLETDELLGFLKGRTPPAPEDALPFLIRGVSYGDDPTIAVIRVRPSSDEAWVHIATARAELFLPGNVIPGRAQAQPLIVFLDRAPTRVFVTGVSGGDRAFRALGPDARRNWSWRGASLKK